MDWNDLRIILAVDAHGSLRAAGTALGVNHATVMRRIRRMEESLQTRLFDRMPEGYHLTGAGEDILRTAITVETEMLAMERRVIGRNAQIEGRVKLTAPDGFLIKLLMPDLSVFMETYPNICLDIDTSFETSNLDRREADIALRVTAEPPDHLIGKRLATIKLSYYATPSYLDRHDPDAPDSTANWIGWNEDEDKPDWILQSPFPHLRMRGRIVNHVAQLEAVKAGVGIAILPCYIGDLDDKIIRVQPDSTVSHHQLWLLADRDILKTARVRALWNHLLLVFEKVSHRIEGEMSA